MNNEPPAGNTGTAGQAGIQGRLQAFVDNPANGKRYAEGTSPSGVAVLSPDNRLSSPSAVDTAPAQKKGVFRALADLLVGRGKTPAEPAAPTIPTPDTQLDSTQPFPLMQATDQLQVISNPGSQTAPFSLNQTQNISIQDNPTDRLPNIQPTAPLPKVVTADTPTDQLPNLDNKGVLTEVSKTNFSLPPLPDDPALLKKDGIDVKDVAINTKESLADTKKAAGETLQKWNELLQNKRLNPLLAHSWSDFKDPDVLKKMAIQTGAGMAAGAGIRVAFAAAGLPGFAVAALAAGALKGAVYAIREADRIHAAEGRKIENKNLKDLVMKRFTELPREKRSQVYKAALRGAVEGIVWNVVGATMGHEALRLTGLDVAITEGTSRAFNGFIDTIKSFGRELPSQPTVDIMTGQSMDIHTATPTPSAMESWAKIPTVTPAAEGSIVSNNVAKFAEHFNPSHTPEAVSTPTPAEIMAQPTPTPTPTVEASLATPTLTPTGTEIATPTFTPTAELTSMDSVHSSLTSTPTPTAELPTASPTLTATEIQSTPTLSTATETLAPTPTLTNETPGAPPIETNPILTPNGIETPTLAPHTPELPTLTTPAAEATVDTQINQPGGMDHPIATAAPTETTPSATAETPAASQATIGPDLSPRQKAAEYLLNIKQTELPVPGGGPSNMAQKFITDMIGAENAAKIPEENMQEYIRKVAYQIAADNNIAVPDWNLTGATDQFHIPADKQMIISNETRNILSQIMDNALPANK